MLHGSRVPIYGKHLAPFAQQVDKVAPIPASRIQYAHPACNVAPQDLVEDVDIDLSKLLLNVQRHSSPSVL
jgi:hypothetical protein